MSDDNLRDLSEVAADVAGHTWFTVYLSSRDGPLRDVEFSFTRDGVPHPVILTATSHQSFEAGTWGDVIYRLEDARFVCMATKENCAKHFTITVYSGVQLPTGFRLRLAGVGAGECKVTVKRQYRGVVFQDTVDGDDWHAWQL